MVIAAVISLALAFCAAAQAESIAGHPRVVDGDTLHFVKLGQRIRLVGIDTPETRQSCKTSHGERYRCGQAAAEALKMRIGSKVVRCKGEERGRYGRLIAVCFDADGTDLNGWLVEQGHALAYRRYSMRYVAQETAARKAKRGIWQGDFVKPWRWRRGDRLPEHPRGAAEQPNE